MVSKIIDFSANENGAETLGMYLCLGRKAYKAKKPGTEVLGFLKCIIRKLIQQQLQTSRLFLLLCEDQLQLRIHRHLLQVS